MCSHIITTAFHWNHRTSMMEPGAGPAAHSARGALGFNENQMPPALSGSAGSLWLFVQTWGLDHLSDCPRRLVVPDSVVTSSGPWAASLMTSLPALRPETRVNPASQCDDGLPGWVAPTGRSAQTRCCLEPHSLPLQRKSDPAHSPLPPVLIRNSPSKLLS